MRFDFRGTNLELEFGVNSSTLYLDIVIEVSNIIMQCFNLSECIYGMLCIDPKKSYIKVFFIGVSNKIM